MTTSRRNEPSSLHLTLSPSTARSGRSGRGYTFDAAGMDQTAARPLAPLGRGQPQVIRAMSCGPASPTKEGWSGRQIHRTLDAALPTVEGPPHPARERATLHRRLGPARQWREPNAPPRP
jgi:hypothetical protein